MHVTSLVGSVATQIGTTHHRRKTRVNPAFHNLGHSVSRTAAGMYINEKSLAVFGRVFVISRTMH